MTTLEALARFVTRLEPESLAESTRLAIGRAVLDLVGAAIAGFSHPAVRAARETACRHYRSGRAAVWFSGRRLSPSGAAFANAAAASALDLDDGHRRAGGHPGACMIPAALALAEELQVGQARTMAAIALGYEVGVRVSAARDLARLDTLSTGRWCGFGAAAASAYLMGLDERQTAHAMAIAGVIAPGLSASGYSRQMGNSVKEGIAFATAQGVQAADLAALGYSGPLDILDHRGYFDPDLVLDGLRAPVAVEEVYFKPYGCCRWIHAAIDAALDLRDRHGLGDGIESIRVDTFARALRLSNERAPETLEGAQYSLPFAVAAALSDGGDALLPLREALLARLDIRRLAERVVLAVDPALDALFPEKAAARVTLRHRGQDYVREVQSPLGDPDNPLSMAQLAAKLARLAGATPAARAFQARLLALGTETGLSDLALGAVLSETGPGDSLDTPPPSLPAIAAPGDGGRSPAVSS